MKYKFIMHLLNYFFNRNTTMTNYELKHYILTCPNFLKASITVFFNSGSKPIV